MAIAVTLNCNGLSICVSRLNLESLQDENLWLYAVLICAVLAKVSSVKFCLTLERILNLSTEGRKDKLVLVAL